MGVSRTLDRGARYPTYAALGPRTERPSDYEIATARLHYYVGRGFAVNVPAQAWYERYQQGSPFRCDDWESFVDPAATTYSAYMARSRALELELDSVCERAETRGDPGRLSDAWRASLAHTLGPLRYPFHGMHMIACYIGQMAPSGRITICALLQAAGELRRIDRLAYRTRELQLLTPGFAEDARERWEEHADYQPLREVIERMLVSYDWGEAFVALNLCLKPSLDRLLARGFAPRAAAAGDEVLQAIVSSFEHDAGFQRSWSHALLAQTCARDDTRAAVTQWIERWRAPVMRAVQALAPSFGVDRAALDAIFADHEAWLCSLPGVPHER